MAVSDWDRRELCPDGSCTGLIGPEGTCKVCGHAAPNWGDERKRGTIDPADADADADAASDLDPADAAIAPSARAEIGGGEWATRQLCVDGGCTGLIGGDGRCKVCGKPAGPAVAGGASDETEDDDDKHEDDEDDDYEDDYEHDGDEDGDETAREAELEAVADELAGIKPLGSIEIEDAEDRALCPDGACIGVIGADGKCKVCGKDAA